VHHLSLFVDKYCRVAKKNGRYVGMFQLPSSVYFVFTTTIPKGLCSHLWLTSFQDSSQVCQDIEKIEKQLDILCGVKVSLQCWVCYDIFLQRLVIVSSMYNYGAASHTWILALAKLTRKGLFESYQLMQTSSATTSTMKWCHSVRLLHSKCTSVSHAMPQSAHGFLVVCTLCVGVCVCVCVNEEQD
jgi:hypothetical protein